MHAEPRLSQQQNIARSSDMVCIIMLNVFKGMYMLNKNIKIYTDSWDIAFFFEVG